MFSFLTAFTRPVNALRGVLAAFLFLSLVTCASAQVGFTFDNANQTATSGTDIVFYDGTLTNGTQPSSIQGFDINFSIPDAVDASPLADYLNNNAPDPLPANYEYNLTPFVIIVPYSVATGTYNGTFTLNYLTGDVESATLQNFSLTVTQTEGFGFTFNQPFQSVSAGTSSLIFDAILDNGSAETIIDGYNFSFDGAADGLTIDSSPFDAYLTNNDSIPSSAIFGQSLFAVNVSDAAAPGEYGGTATISYTTNGISNTAVQNFTVQVTGTIRTAAPEPATLMLMLIETTLAGVIIACLKMTNFSTFPFK